MLALIICALAFYLSYLWGRRSLAHGLTIVLASGYFYGILRANLGSPFGHFIFDAAVLGLYFSQSWGQSDSKRVNDVRIFTLLLMGWPLLECLLPFQSPLISIVGLRSNAFLLPILLLGTRLTSKDLLRLGYGLAVLNLVVSAFSIAEYFLGIGRFFPLTAYTSLLYESRIDVIGFLRIPGTFVSSHVYAGTMVSGIPFLFGAWLQSGQSSLRRLLLMAGVAAALLGVLMASTRVNFVAAVIVVGVGLFSGRLGSMKRIGWVLVILAIGYFAFTNQRFGRFKSLADSDMVSERIGGSVNRTFFEILVDYPMGNGLGAGGTSIPYFLQNQVKYPVAMESEYARILLEQGVIGLLLWISFIFWFLSRLFQLEKGEWLTARRMAYAATVCSLGIGLVGIGLLTSVPNSLLTMLSMGWVLVKQPPELRHGFQVVRLADRDRIKSSGSFNRI
jgi:hypothetical protein